MNDYPEAVVAAAPGHVALYIEKNKLYQNSIVAWQTDPVVPLTLFEQWPDAVLFPDGHVENLEGTTRWTTLAAFRKARGV